MVAGHDHHGQRRPGGARQAPCRPPGPSTTPGASWPPSSSCPRPDHVVFTTNSTEALNIAITGILSARRPRDLHRPGAQLRPAASLPAGGRTPCGTAVSFVPADRQGPHRLRRTSSGFIRPETRAIVCTHASNLTGNLIDVARVGAIAQRHRALASSWMPSQTAGCIPIDMEDMGIDVLCFTGHKGLMGPQGTGGLCIREGVEIRPWKVGGCGVQSYIQRPAGGVPHPAGGRHPATATASPASPPPWTTSEEVGPGGHPGRQERRPDAPVLRRVSRQIDGVTVYGDFSGRSGPPSSP